MIACIFSYSPPVTAADAIRTAIRRDAGGTPAPRRAGRQ